MKKATIMLAVLLSTSTAFAQQRIAKQSAPDHVVPFVEVKGEPDYEPARFEYSADGYKYTISSNGRGTRTGGSTAARHFNLRLSAGDSLRRSIYFAEFEGDLLLICEVGDEEYASGFVARLDGQTMKTEWKRSIPGFNVGQGLLERNHAYVTAIGFVAKVNVRSGAFVWKHTNLYRNNDFNSFELPQIEGTNVLFTEVTYNKPVKTIVVNKRSGRILSVKAAGK